jgi:predicted aldo/keto reductase-like oxidoreductase
MGKMPMRVLGKTGQRISILGFGTAPAGTRLNVKEAVSLYEEALNSGVNYFDTAPDFAGYGQAQKQLGHLLKTRRKEVFLVTKCFEPDGEAALKLLKSNLNELQTDYADLVFVHSVGADKMNPKVVFGRRGCYSALMKAKSDGLTRFVGLSGHNRPARFAEALKRFNVDVLLNAVNFVDRNTYDFENKVWNIAGRLKVGLIAMKVFGGQLQGRQPNLSHRLMPDRYLKEAFRYAQSIPGVAAAVVGMATQAELRQNVEWSKNFKNLSSREMAQLIEVGKKFASNWGPHLGKIV